AQQDSVASLLRERYLRKLSPLERQLEELPGMEQLRQFIEQSGSRMLAYRLVLLCIVFGVVGAIVTWIWTRMEFAALAAFIACGALPYMKVAKDRASRLAKFEEQLPDA